MDPIVAASYVPVLTVSIKGSRVTVRAVECCGWSEVRLGESLVDRAVRVLNR